MAVASSQVDGPFKRALEVLPDDIKVGLAAAGMADPCTLTHYPRASLGELVAAGVVPGQLTGPMGMDAGMDVAAGTGVGTGYDAGGLLGYFPLSFFYSFVLSLPFVGLSLSRVLFFSSSLFVFMVTLVQLAVGTSGMILA